MAWSSESVLIAGTNNNTLRIYDLRTKTLSSAASTVCTHGVCIDPFSSKIAGFNEVTFRTRKRGRRNKKDLIFN